MHRTAEVCRRRTANAYSALLAGDDYLEEARQALRDGDHTQARQSLAVLSGLIEVVSAELDSQNSEHSV